MRNKTTKKGVINTKERHKAIVSFPDKEIKEVKLVVSPIVEKSEEPFKLSFESKITFISLNEKTMYFSLLTNHRRVIEYAKEVLTRNSNATVTDLKAIGVEFARNNKLKPFLFHILGNDMFHLHKYFNSGVPLHKIKVTHHTVFAKETNNKVFTFNKEMNKIYLDFLNLTLVMEKRIFDRNMCGLFLNLKSVENIKDAELNVIFRK